MSRRGQVMSNALALDAAVELPPHVEHICYLPFAHIAERMPGIHLPCHRASHVHLCTDPTRVGTIRRAGPNRGGGFRR